MAFASVAVVTAPRGWLLVSDTHHQRWLLNLAIGLSKALAANLPQHTVRLRPVPQLVAQPSTTDGWYIALGTIQGQRSSYLDVWLDDYTKAAGRRVCFCLSTKKAAHIRDVVKHLEGEFGKFTALHDSDFKEYEDGQCRLVSALGRHRFLKPIAELYHGPGTWSYLSLYHSSAPNLGKAPRPRILRDGESFLTKLVLAIVGARSSGHPIDFPNIVNRAVVRRHMQRERNATAAYAAKVRDGFTCRVCGFNFARKYGRLGEGFAEAHHVIPLARLKLGTPILEHDLVTVCANCHRMLHRMDGRRTDPAKLRRISAKARSKKR